MPRVETTTHTRAYLNQGEKGEMIIAAPAAARWSVESLAVYVHGESQRGRRRMKEETEQRQKNHFPLALNVRDSSKSFCSSLGRATIDADRCAAAQRRRSHAAGGIRRGEGRKNTQCGGGGGERGLEQPSCRIEEEVDKKIIFFANFFFLALCGRSSQK